MSTKTLTLRINGVTKTLQFAATATRTQIATAFQTEFATIFPTYVFTVTAAGKLSVEGPAGTNLTIEATGDWFVPMVDTWTERAEESDPLIVVIKSGVAEQTYRLSVNGTNVSHSTGTSDNPSSYATENIAQALKGKLEAAGFVVERYTSVLVVRRADNGPIKFDYSDTWNNQAMYAARGRVATQSDLPPRLDPKVVLAVGDVRSGGYYVRYAYRESTSKGFTDADPGTIEYGGGTTTTTSVMSGASLSFLKPSQPQTVSYSGWVARESGGTGIYEETYRPGARTSFAAGTMPHVLIRQADGSFVFKQAEWSQRQVGDEQSVPAPSFVGKRIHDVFFFRNRLGFLTDENVVLSKAGLFFDFWPDTAKEVLDSDPIDLMVSSTKVSILRYAEPFNSNLLVFGDTTQWIVTAQGAMTPRTVSVQPSTDFVCSKNVRPVSVGPTVYFAAEKGPWASVWEYFLASDTYQNTAQEVTQHVPRYIPAGLKQVAGSPTENILVGLTDGDKKAMYVYKFLWVNQEKVQESWSRWSFSGEVVNVMFMGSVLYIAVNYAGEGLYLEKLDLQDLTDDQLVDRRGHINWKPYTMVYEFSPFYLRANDKQSVVGNKNILKTMRVFYTKLRALKVAVSQPFRATTVRSFPDASRAEVFRNTATNGSVRVSLNGDADQTRIALINDSPGQCQIQSIEFEFDTVGRSRRL